MSEVDAHHQLVRPWGDQAYTDEGSGRPVVLVHGWSCSSWSWAGVVAPLVTAGHRVVRYDVRGHGRSGWDGRPLVFSDLVDDLAALVDALGLERPVVVGHSLGAMITVELALARPAVPAGIVLVDAGLVARPADHEILALLGAELAEGEGDPARWWELLVPVLYSEGFRTRCPEHVAEAGRRFAEGGLRAKHAVFEALVGRRDPRPLVGELPVPALVVAADHDVLWDVDDHRRTAAHFPSAPVHVVSGAGHMSVEEAPADVAAAVLHFSGRLS